MKKKQQGIALIEAMIALIVFSVALLGLVAMQTRSLVNTATSTSRQTASIQSYAAADMVRAHKNGWKSGDFNLIRGSVAKSNISADCFTSASCTSTEMTNTLVGQWQEVLESALVDGTGVICKDSTPDDGSPTAPDCDGASDLLTIKIWWHENRIDQTEFQRFVTTMEP